VRRALLILAVTVVVGIAIASHPYAQQRSTGSGSGHGHIVTRPALESATDNTAIIRWTADTAGGTATHYGIVRYGTDPKNLDQSARSPIRWNRIMPNMTYRVRLDQLAPGTTYYFTVDAAQADGIAMGLNGRIDRFTTRPRP
jgi:hypothetical protein